MDTRNFSVFFRDEKVADVFVGGIRNTTIIKYTDIPYKQPFRSNTNAFLCVQDFLRSRCYEEGRSDLKSILEEAGLTENDPWAWNQLTHGVTYDDYWWIRFPGETIEWSEVKLRD